MNTTATLFSPLATQQEKALKQRVEANINLNKFFKEIDKIPLTHGARVVYFDAQLSSVILRDFVPFCQSNPPTVILREKPKTISTKEFAAQLKTNERDSRLVSESLNMGLSCGIAVLSWVAITIGVAVSPITGGASLAASALGYSATIASTVQCANGLMRTPNELSGSSLNDHLDSQDWYQGASMALDALSLAGAGASMKTIASVSQKIKSASGVSSLQILKGLTKREKQALTREILRLNNPKISRKALRLLTRTAHKPNNATRQIVSAHFITQISDALGSSLTVIGSARSGVLNSWAIGIYQSVDNL